MSELTRYSVVTPKRPEATCLIAERIESPFGIGLKRSASSPPSPVLDLPPIRFMAIASVVCASREIEPKLIAPVAKRLTMSLAGSTWSSWHRLALLVLGGLDPEQAAQRQQPLGLLVEDLGERLVALQRIAAHGMLQRRDRFGGPGVVLAAGAVGIFAADIERGLVDLRIAERVGVAARGFLGDFGQADALDAGVGAGEILGDEIRLQPDGVEDLRAAIGLIGRDAHLRHHLQQALADRLDVALDDLVVVERAGQPVLHRDDGLERQIRIDRFGAVAGEAGEVMHLARLAGFDHEPDRGAQAGADQMMMHGGAGEQRRDRNPVRARHAVGQDDDVDALAHRAFGARAQFVEHLLHARRAEAGMEGGVERARLEMACRRYRRSSGSFPGPRRSGSAGALRAAWCEARPCRSNRFGRGPMIETRLITSSSRIGSIGGLVTCAKFCLK